jgi:hypothetical protein
VCPDAAMKRRPDALRMLGRGHLGERLKDPHARRVLVLLVAVAFTLVWASATLSSGGG